MGIDEQEENLFGQVNGKDDRSQVSLGAAYTLPMLMILEAEVFHTGNVRVQLMREDIPLTKRMRMGFMVNSDKEYMVELGYLFSRYIGFRTHYDSDMGFGAGVNFNY